MTERQTNSRRGFAYVTRKYLISAFVVATFAAYALHQRSIDPGAEGAALPPQASRQTAAQQAAEFTPVATIYVPTQTPPPAAPQATPAPAVVIGPPAPPANAVKADSQTAAPPTDAPAQVPTDVPTAVPTDAPTPAPATVAGSAYKDGNYTGNVADAFYGPVQVKVNIKGGKIASVQFLDYPHDRRRSAEINDTVMPWLQTEAIQAQSAQVDIISGATLTSEAFIESLQTALDTAKTAAKGA